MPSAINGAAPRDVSCVTFVGEAGCEPEGKVPALGAEEFSSNVSTTRLVSGAAYCCVSMAMVLLNKMALSNFHFTSVSTLLAFQCGMCLILAKLCELLGLVTLEPPSRRLIRAWLPVNFIFVGMIATSFLALRGLNVATAIVLKNLTNLFTICGDWYLYGRRYGIGVWACMGLMLLSAICSAATDLSFNAEGYFWQILNCAFAAAYSLYLRGAMDRVKQFTSGERLNECSMVFYNNLMSLPFMLGTAAFKGELSMLYAGKESDLAVPAFLAVALLSGLLAFGISFCSLWFLGSTTPTVYSLVGSLNKIPLSVVGIFLFSAPRSMQNLCSILVGLLAGVVFAVVRSKHK